MKLFLMIVALLLQAPAPRGSVTGTVTVAATSAPIPDAEVSILTPEGLFETTTDVSGRFSLANIPVGRQTVFIRADGFFVESTTPDTPFIPRAEVPVAVTAGTTPVAVPKVSMVQGGTIIGKVLDPQGKPMPVTRVQALRPVPPTRGSDGLLELSSRMTDDRGEYRMFWVPPGEYVIRALVQGGGPRNPTAVPNVTEMQMMVSTLFPSTTDTAQASKVTVKPGEEVRGVDISVKVETVAIPSAPKVTRNGFKISGQVIDGLQPRVGTGTLVLGSESEAGPPQAVGEVIIGGTPGAFEIPNVPPGNYDLFVRMVDPLGSVGAGGATQAWGRTTLEVRDGDVENVRMTIHPSVDVPGVVKIDGNVVPAGGTLRVGLSPLGVAGRIANYRGILNRAQAPGDEGKVSIPGAAEANYEVFIQGVPDNLYIADVRQGDTSILISGIAVRNVSPAPFEVLIASDGGTVEGVVLNTEKKPVANAMVVLVPSDRQMLRLSKTGAAAADGKYSFHGVRPGEYKVFAAPPGITPAGGITPELLSRIEPKGTSVTVKAVTSATADVVTIAD